MKIAVEGCIHGELDNVYATLMHLQKVENIKIDLLICCGDFQAVRNVNDLNSLDAINKHRRMNSFWKYYSGERVAPFPTIFIGGNHEASNYLWELYYGGWAAPNIYFLGFAGVIKFGDVRIAGISGVYNGRSYYKGHYEKLPYNTKDVETVYHVREYEVHKLMQVEEPIDIFLSHDWPLHITDCGNLRNLFRVKPFFEDEIREGTLGNPAATELMLKLKPPYWFSAHLHCKFAALVQHPGSDQITKFLALDKCLPKRNFLQVIDIESGPGPHELHYDEEWLAITRKFNPVFPLTKSMAHLSNAKLSIHECREFVKNKLRNRGYKPFEFVRTAPCHNPLRPGAAQVYPCGESLVGAGQVRNPQTVSLVQLLELEYFLDSSTEAHKPTQGPQSFISSGSLHFNYKNSEEIDIDDEDDIDELEVVRDPEGKGCKRARKLT